MTIMSRAGRDGKTHPGLIEDAEGISAELRLAADDLAAAIVRLLRALDGERERERERAQTPQPAQRQAAASLDDGRLAYTVSEASRLVGISSARLNEQIRAGRLPVTRVGRRALVSRVELERWLAAAGGGRGEGEVYGPIPEMALRDRRRKTR